MDKFANNATDRITNVGNDTGKYQVYASSKEQTVTVPDITDMIQVVKWTKVCCYLFTWRY